MGHKLVTRLKFQKICIALLCAYFVWMYLMVRTDKIEWIGLNGQRYLGDRFSVRILIPFEKEDLLKLRTPECGDKLFLLILVHSSPENSKVRNVIRETWAKINNTEPYLKHVIKQKKPYNVMKTLFLLGYRNETTQISLAWETNLYGDLLIGSFNDSYANLTRKTRMSLDWAYRHCKYEYLLKTDDDVFVNTVALINWLWMKPRKRFYTGRCDFSKRVIRKPDHKWSVSKKEYPKGRYPPYCIGMGIILSSDVVRGIMKVIKKEELFKLEDVYVGLLIRNLDMKVKPVDNRNFFHVHFKQFRGDLCRKKHVLLLHSVNASYMSTLHRKFHQVRSARKS